MKALRYHIVLKTFSRLYILSVCTRKTYVKHIDKTLKLHDCRELNAVPMQILNDCRELNSVPMHYKVVFFFASLVFFFASLV